MAVIEKDVASLWLFIYSVRGNYESPSISKKKSVVTVKLSVVKVWLELFALNHVISNVKVKIVGFSYFINLIGFLIYRVDF